MSNFLVTLNRIECLRTSRELAADEVFMVVVPVIGRIHPGSLDGEEFGPSNVDGQILRGHVTRVETGVRRGDSWCPQPASVTFAADERDALSLCMFLYERDDGALRRELTTRFAAGEWPITIRDDPDLSAVWERFLSQNLPDVVTPPVSMTEVLVRLFKGFVSIMPVLIGELRKDDIVGAVEFVARLNDDNTFLSREFEFAGGRARYVSSVTLSRV